MQSHPPSDAHLLENNITYTFTIMETSELGNINQMIFTMDHMIYRLDHMIRPAHLLTTLLELHQNVVQEQNKKSLLYHNHLIVVVVIKTLS